jgi:hypothetical protein
MLSEINQAQKDKYSMISLICGILNSWFYRSTNRMEVTKGWSHLGGGNMLVERCKIIIE